MRSLKLTLRRDTPRPDLATVDLVVTADPGAHVGTLARALAERDPEGGHSGHGLTLRVEGAGHPLAPDEPLDRCDLRSGAVVRLVPAGSVAPASHAEAAMLHIRKGPDAARMPQVPLRRGENAIGRDPACRIVLTDLAVSGHHAKIVVTDVVEIVDTNSTNGVIVGGGLVSRARLRPGDVAIIGDTEISVSLPAGVLGDDEATRPDDGRGAVEVAFNRPPRLDPTYPGQRHSAPQPPQRPAARRFPLVPMIAPLLIGVTLFLITGSVFSLVFVVLSPFMVVGTYIEDAAANRRAFRAAVTDFRTELATLNAQLYAAGDSERALRQHEHPALAEVLDAVRQRGPLLWTRRPEQERFLELRLGLGRLPSRDEIELPQRDRAPAFLWDELHKVVDAYATVDDVPVVARLAECGALGIAGPDEAMTAMAAGIVVQLVGLHSPADLILTAVMSAEGQRRWSWLSWLPHTSPYPDSPHTPLRSAHLTMGGAATANLVAELDDLVARRRERGADVPKLPAVVLLVDGATDADRSRLVDLAERGPDAGVYVIWTANRITGLPAVCRTFVELEDQAGVGSAGFVRAGEAVTPVRLEPLDAASADQVARRLAPVIDAGARFDDGSALPRSVSFVSLMESEVHRNPADVLDRWRESGSLGPVGMAGEVRANRLRALVGTRGSGVDERYWLDLRQDGPHALVGGTTGAGKSEFLQTWILSLATTYSPQRVTFLLVDYKGGSAFGPCDQLPHSVGLVTDLTPRLVHRALTSLRAELTHREHRLNELGAKDLDALEGTPHAGALPRLVIVVDEFAALRKEVPEFVDGVVDVAQRGRSLGLHLVLATQRPAGVITDNLRANTNLRVALRMADETDSTDVLGHPVAAGFDPGIPGRAAAKTGPGRLVTFQAAYVGGWTSDTPPAPDVTIRSLTFGPGYVWSAPQLRAVPTSERGAKDIDRIVTTVRKAFTQARHEHGLHLPRPPWLDELPAQIDLAGLLRRPGVGPADVAELVLGRQDIPRTQSQPLLTFQPDEKGNLVVYGAGGAGKSTLLRTLAVAAVHGAAGPCHVYGLDYGTRSLRMLEEVPQVGSIVQGEDRDRVGRLLRHLRQVINERARAFAAVQASSIVDYWRRRGYDLDRPDWTTPRILLLLDGVAAFYQDNQPGSTAGNFERLVSIATDGRPVGVHLALSADRSNAVPSSLLPALQSQIVLRLSGDNEYRNLGLPVDSLDPDAPPGRGVVGQGPRQRNEIQVAVFGGPDQPAQHEALRVLAATADAAATAPAVQTWPDVVTLESLPRQLGDRPVIGIEGATLGPIGFPATGGFVVTGPNGSARQVAVETICQSVRQCRPETTFYYVGKAGSPLVGWAGWTQTATDLESARHLPAAQAPSPVVLAIESLNDYAVGLSAADQLYLTVKALLDRGDLVVVEGEAGLMQQMSPLHNLIRSYRRGLVLQPSINYVPILQVEFPRGIRQADYPAERGLLVDGTGTTEIQIARPTAAGVTAARIPAPATAP